MVGARQAFTRYRFRYQIRSKTPPHEWMEQANIIVIRALDEELAREQAEERLDATWEMGNWRWAPRDPKDLPSFSFWYRRSTDEGKRMITTLAEDEEAAKMNIARLLCAQLGDEWEWVRDDAPTSS